MTDKPPVTDLEAIKLLAAQRRDDFEVMRYMLQRDDDVSDTQIDAVVASVAAPIVDMVDCTACANCCRSLDVYLTPQDAHRLSERIDISLDDISTRYIDHESAALVEEWGKFQVRPCAFLNGNLCSVYSHRPETCRTYPVFTPDFRWILDDLIEGASICPIIYNVLSVMVEKTDELVRDGAVGASY